MPDRKFKVGDIVRATREGKTQGVACYRDEKATVVSLCPGDNMGGEFLIQLITPDMAYKSGRWREKWYELVDPEGPW